MLGGEGYWKWCCLPLSLHIHLLLPAWEKDNHHFQSHGELSHQQAIPLAVLSPVLLAAETTEIMLTAKANAISCNVTECNCLSPSISMPSPDCSAISKAFQEVFVCVCACVYAQVSAPCTVLVSLRVCSYQCMWLVHLPAHHSFLGYHVPPTGTVYPTR